MGDQGKEDENSWSDYSVEDGLSMLENAKQFLEQVVGFHKIFRRFLQKVTVSDIRWHSRFGLGDLCVNRRTYRGCMVCKRGHSWYNQPLYETKRYACNERYSCISTSLVRNGI